MQWHNSNYISIIYLLQLIFRITPILSKCYCSTNSNSNNSFNSNNSNSSQWILSIPLWMDLMELINTTNCLEDIKKIPKNNILEAWFHMVMWRMNNIINQHWIVLSKEINLYLLGINLRELLMKSSSSKSNNN